MARKSKAALAADMKTGAREALDELLERTAAGEASANVQTEIAQRLRREGGEENDWIRKNVVEPAGRMLSGDRKGAVAPDVIRERLAPVIDGYGAEPDEAEAPTE